MRSLGGNGPGGRRMAARRNARRVAAAWLCAGSDAELRPENRTALLRGRVRCGRVQLTPTPCQVREGKEKETKAEVHCSRGTHP